MLSLEGVEKTYAGRRVVSRTDLRVARGERVALIGPSGSGKSTLLRMVIGLVAPDAGRVRVGDVEVGPETARDVRRRVGWVPQDGGLFPHLTAVENVTLVARLRRVDGARVGARLAELSEVARLSSATLARYPGELSGGEKQRVALMRALLLEPEVVLLDEPLAALDPIVRAKLQQDLRAAFEDRTRSVLLVTHDLAEAATLADTIVVLRAGQVVERGTMKALSASTDPFVRELLSSQRSLAEALA